MHEKKNNEMTIFKTDLRVTHVVLGSDREPVSAMWVTPDLDICPDDSLYTEIRHLGELT